jgi:hypothetical protein
MTPVEIKETLREVLSTGISLNATSYLILAVLWLLSTVIGAAVSGVTAVLVRKHGEAVAAGIAEKAAVQRKRWEAKFECYSRIAEAFGELVSKIETASLPESITAVVERINTYGTVARIAVRPQVRTLLSHIGSRLNGAETTEERRAIAYRGWLAVIDVARADLFGEPREMTDEEVLA